MRHAFSLVELSIVLVILGLLTGGILAGQSLIRAAELRAVTTELNRYIAATQTFRDKYFAIPGDMAAATKFWGRTNSGADCVTNSSAAVAAPGTCDGNGDGIPNNAGAASKSGESFQFWNQLALAGLIEGTYSGYAGSGGITHAVIGTNVPTSKISSAGWSLNYSPNYVGDTQGYAMDYGTHFRYGAGNTTGPTQGAILKPEEAWNIDTKIDDGKPSYGKVIAYFWNNACATGGATNADLANSVYNLTNSSVQCGLFFRQIF